MAVTPPRQCDSVSGFTGDKGGGEVREGRKVKDAPEEPLCSFCIYIARAGCAAPGPRRTSQEACALSTRAIFICAQGAAPSPWRSELDVRAESEAMCSGGAATCQAGFAGSGEGGRRCRFAGGGGRPPKPPGSPAVGLRADRELCVSPNQILFPLFLFLHGALPTGCSQARPSLHRPRHPARGHPAPPRSSPRKVPVRPVTQGPLPCSYRRFTFK